LVDIRVVEVPGIFAALKAARTILSDPWSVKNSPTGHNPLPLLEISLFEWPCGDPSTAAYVQCRMGAFLPLHAIAQPQSRGTFTGGKRRHS